MAIRTLVLFFASSNFMKILLVSFVSGDPDGGRRYIDQIFQSLIQAGCDVYLFLLYDGSSVPELYRNSPRVKTKLYRHGGKLQWLMWENLINASLYSELRQYVQEIQPNAVHIHHYKALRTMLLATRGFSRVWTIHALEFIHPMYELAGLLGANQFSWHRKVWAYLIARKLNVMRLLIDYWVWNDVWLKRKFFKATICPSQEIFSLATQYRFLSPQYVPHFTNFPEPIIVRYDDFFLFAGRCDYRKGVEYLVRGFGQAHKKNPELRLVIAGGGKNSVHVSSMIHADQLSDAVTLLPSLNVAELNHYYRTCLAVVIPSIAGEAGPLVALEAMSFSKPIIASKVGGLVDLVQNGKNGLLVSPEDSDAIAKAMVRLWDDRQLAQMLGTRGQQLLNTRWTKVNHVNSLTNIYRQVVAKSG